jgi:uncharacterized repeat protein (TIGR02543 family)
MIRKYIILITLMAVGVTAQQPVINEILQANGSILTDEDGHYSDWIEIYNPGSTTIDLKGYGLSDDEAKPLKWLFPSVALKPFEHFIVFASGKDQRSWVNQWETVVDWGDLWRYRPGTTPPPTGWKQLSFNDDGWESGPSGFGYGDDDDATLIDPVLSLFLRKIVIIENPQEIELALLHIDYDDAFVAYLNGIEIARANIGVPGTPPAYNEEALISHEASGSPEKFMIANIKSILQPGENILAIQVHNANATSSDMTAIPFFTLGKSVAEPREDLISPYLALTPLFLHTNFKVNDSGESILLSTPDGIVLNTIILVKATLDISYGRYPDGESSWYYFQEPTPGLANGGAGLVDITPAVIFSHSGGFFSCNLMLSLTNTHSGSQIRYTLDGSLPDEYSLIYEEPIAINQTTIIRACAFADGMLPGNVTSQTYFIGETFTLPVISLSTNPENLWDEQSGIYVEGPNAEPADPHFGANYWQDWERLVHIEYFDSEGMPGFAMDCGVKIYGAWSRAHPQKSLALYARSKYGFDEIAYPLFKEKNINAFQSIVLRNSGNDWNYTMFRDALMTGLVSGEDIDIQAYQPVVLFINSEYWGVINMREKISEHFIAENHPVDFDNLDMLENAGYVIHGDQLHYQELWSFLEANNLAADEQFKFVTDFIDLDNFIKYQVAQIYFDNKDWPGNNIKYWRPRLPGGKWRWILYDTDFGFSIYDGNAYTYNTLAFALETNGPDWPNPPWSTFILRKLLENSSFKNRFINRFADYLNSIFSADAVTDKINQMQQVLEPEMDRHFDRWGSSMNTWYSRINTMIRFAEERPDYMRTYIRSEFNLSGTYVFTSNIDPPEGGKIRINTLAISQANWKGSYFNSIPITVSAIPQPGYRFNGWQGASSEKKATISINSNKNIVVTAKFIKDDDYRVPVVINEINYNSLQTYNTGDWLELMNNSDTPVDLSGWSFSDAGAANPYIFPVNTVIEANAYLVISEDQMAFSKVFSGVYNRIGDLNFGLANEGEYIQLLDSRGVMIDSLTFDDKAPWPVEADGTGATLSLRHPTYDNALAESWLASGGLGTPGKRNDIYDTREEQPIANIPHSFRLQQNYPNPFNNATMINYQLSLSSQVELSVYNLLGQKLVTLVSQRQPAGQYQVQWDTGGFTSGIYFYRLTTDQGFRKVRKMILLR